MKHLGFWLAILTREVANLSPASQPVSVLTKTLNWIVETFHLIQNLLASCCSLVHHSQNYLGEGEQGEHHIMSGLFHIHYTMYCTYSGVQTMLVLDWFQMIDRSSTNRFPSYFLDAVAPRLVSYISENWKPHSHAVQNQKPLTISPKFL